MKIWNDSAVFDRFHPRLFHERGDMRYYSIENVRSQELVVMPDPPQWAMLWGTVFYRSRAFAGTCQRREKSDFLAIEHVREGQLLFRQDGRMYLVEPGDVCLMLPGHCHEFIVDTGSCVKSSLLMVGPLLGDMLERTGLAGSDVLSGVDGGKFEAILDLFRELSADVGWNAAERLGCLSFEVLQLLTHRRTVRAVPVELRKLLDYMESHLEEKLSRELLARRCGCSVPALIRLFRTSLDSSPYRVLTRLRMQRAVRLLVERELSVKEIAARVGYDNALNFSTEFRKRYGVPPSAYRRRFCGM